MQNSDEYQLLVKRILTSRTEREENDSGQRQFEVAVHVFLREAAERGMTAGELLAQLDVGIQFTPLIDLICIRLFGAVGKV